VTAQRPVSLSKTGTFYSRYRRDQAVRTKNSTNLRKSVEPTVPSTWTSKLASKSESAEVFPNCAVNARKSKNPTSPLASRSARSIMVIDQDYTRDDTSATVNANVPEASASATPLIDHANVTTSALTTTLRPSPAIPTTRLRAVSTELKTAGQNDDSWCVPHISTPQKRPVG